MNILPGRSETTRSVLARDVVAGLTLAAITIPEQMATARLAHFPPEAGFLAFIAATIGFLLIGANRILSVGADSTIAPIFAAGLALVATQGSPAYTTLAAVLAIMVGLLVGASGFCRMGWISNLLSAPVTTGFLAGIAVHIVASQLPVLCGLVPSHEGSLAALAHTDFAKANICDVALGAGVFLITAVAERLDRRWPGALAGVIGVTCITMVFALDRHGVQLLGAISPPHPHLPLQWPDVSAIVRLAPLALLLALVVMVQSAAVSGSFTAGPDQPADVNRDFLGVGAANILSGLCGAFPVNASPPRTAVVSEAGGQSKAAGVAAGVAVAALAIFGSGLLRHVPAAALAGILFFIALRIVKFDQAGMVWRQSRPEFLLMTATALAIVVFPIEVGVGVGILFSLLHGTWMTTRAQVITLKRITGTSIWWPPLTGIALEETPGVLVLGFQAPLSFLNAGTFRHGFEQALVHAPQDVRLVVLEASSIVEIDYTAAHAVCAAIGLCRERNAAFAVARLESIRAQKSFHRFGITEAVGVSHIFRSVNEAVQALARPTA
ncbi:MAG TPA: SulP family inorganic anion transporter [Rhizomicrobium sp.]|jgi:MFS superfamily sulfate permease-like transporter|nr:SulP family inorganic anion transporter [Rhizomicrobium sp.]